MSKTDLSRRSLLKSMSASVGLALVIDIGGVPAFAAGPPDFAAFGPTVWKAWLTIHPDNRITLINPEVEFGQGTALANAMLLLEELDADLASVDIVAGDNNRVYTNPRGFRLATDSSYGMRGRYLQMRNIGATARELLKSAASLQWNVPVSELTTAHGVVTHTASNRQATFGTLAQSASAMPMPTGVPLRDPSTWKLAGKAVKRPDTPAKSTGAALYGVDYRMPGLLHAAFARSPTLDGTVKSVDDSRVKGRKGVRHIFAVGYGVAVLADTPWAARKGAEDLVVEWAPGPAASLTMAGIAKQFQDAIESGKGAVVAKAVGDVVAAKKTPGATILTADYTVPYLAHMCTEPTNSTAWMHDGIAEFWSPTASMTNLVNACGHLFGMKPEQVLIHRPDNVGGSFGLRGRVDVDLEAAQLSKLASCPVQVVRRREEDVQHSWYRPYEKARVTAAIGPDGTLLGWKQTVAVQAINSHFADELAPFGADMVAVNKAVRAMGAFYAMPVDYFATSGTPISLNYAIPSYLVEGIKMEIPVPVVHWRSVGYSGNMFITEGMIDEIAHAAKADPLEYRLRLYQGKPRQEAVLRRLKALTSWPKGPAANVHWGMAFSESFQSFSACAVAVSVVDKKITVHKAVAVCDQGVTINPNQTIAQVQGGMLDGLATTFWGEITIEDGQVQQSNFSDYELFALKHSPTLQIEIVDSKEAPGSLTESITPMMMPALVNALFTATGDRVRELPLRRSGYEMNPPVRSKT